jgi:endoglucanase
MKQWDGKTIDKAFLKKDRIERWQPLERKGVGIHVGEWGAHNRTPHDVTLAWMRDQLALWREVGWGWALWNLRGSFGVLDSGRSDVQYEDFRGRKLDRKMLEVLQAG